MKATDCYPTYCQIDGAVSTAFLKMLLAEKGRINIAVSSTLATSGIGTIASILEQSLSNLDAAVLMSAAGQNQRFTCSDQHQADFYARDRSIIDKNGAGGPKLSFSASGKLSVPAKWAAGRKAAEVVSLFSKAFGVLSNAKSLHERQQVVYGATKSNGMVDVTIGIDGSVKVSISA